MVKTMLEEASPHRPARGRPVNRTTLEEASLHRTARGRPVTRTTLEEVEPHRTAQEAPVTRTMVEEEASRASVEEPYRTARAQPVTRTMVVEASEVKLPAVELALVEELDLAPFLLDFRPQTLERSTSRTVMAASATRIMQGSSKTQDDERECAPPGLVIPLIYSET